MDQQTKSGRIEAPHGGGTTPVPNGLLDGAMPRLRDTELRVLLVVVRQTLGWQEGPSSARRKERDWLTQSQLMRRTGRASGAVARAVDALVRAGLIEVSDRTGAPLGTPAERRRHLGRLYYCLSMAAGPGKVTSKSEHAKAHTTKESKYKNICKANLVVDKPVENPLVIRGGWSRAGADTRHISFLSGPDLSAPEINSLTP